MSGILDNKKRVIDVILTQEGKRQIAQGNLKIDSYTFSDASIKYAADVASGSFDATSTFYFEACNLPQDSITFESNDDGRLLPFNNGQSINVIDGQITSYDETSDVDVMTLVRNVDFNVSASTLLNQSLENFKNLRLIATKDQLFDTDGFGVGTSNIQFLLTDEKPIAKKNVYKANLNNEESIFYDARFANSINFLYLPPLNKVNDNVDKSNHQATKKFQLGKYPKLGKTNLEGVSYKQLRSELDEFSSMGYEKIISFDPTTKQNNLMLQFFEKRFDQLAKLDIVNFGRYQTFDSSYPFATVYFVGKLLTDDNDTHTFVHLFTLIFEE